MISELFKSPTLIFCQHSDTCSKLGYTWQ